MTAAAKPVFSGVIHSPVRLRICGLLRRVSELEFAVVRDTLEVNDAHLSKNLKVLADAGFITVRKERSQTRNNARRLTWVSLTPEGVSALESHLAALSAIVGEEWRRGDTGAGARAPAIPAPRPR